MLAGSLLLAGLTADSPVAQAFAGVALMGLGFGLINSVFVISTQSAVGWELRGTATSSNIFMRQIGQAVGSATFGAVFNIGIYARIPDAGATVGRLMDPRTRGSLGLADLARDANAVAQSLHGVYLILTVLALAEFCIILALPPALRPEHATPAPQAMAQGVRSA
jgi:hypothetical protein